MKIKVLLIGLSLSLLGGLLLLIFDPHTLPITNIRMEAHLINTNPQTLQTTLSQVARGGFWNVDLTAVRLAILALPWVKEAQVQRQWPETLILLIQEHQAIARWQDKALVNKEGHLFVVPPSSVTKSMNLPILSGPVGSAIQVFKHYQLLSPLVQAAGLQIQKLSLSVRLAWQMNLDNGIKLMFGRDDSEVRLRRFLKVYPRLLNVPQSRPVFVDLRYTNGMAVQMALAE